MGAALLVATGAAGIGAAPPAGPPGAVVRVADRPFTPPLPVPKPSPPAAAEAGPSPDPGPATVRRAEPPPPPPELPAPSVEAPAAPRAPAAAAEAPPRPALNPVEPPPIPPILAERPPAPAGPPGAAPDPQVAAVPEASPAGDTAPEGDRFTIAFGPGSVELGDAGDRLLAGLAQRMRDDEDLRLQVRAYAGGTPDTAGQARRLSLNRALAVRGALVDRGVRGTRIDVRALGNTAPDGPQDRVDLQFSP